MRKALLSILFLALLVLPRPALAGEPTDALKGRVDKILVLLNSSQYKQSDSQSQRHMLRSNMEDFFDEQELAKRTLAAHWKKFSPEQQQEFTKLFTDFLERVYISRIQAYTNEKVAYTGEKLVDNRALVQTKIVSPSKEIPLDYSLLKTAQGWKIYDVSVEGVDLVMNYRNQFNDILVNGKPEDLLAKLRDKIKQADQGQLQQ